MSEDTANTPADVPAETPKKGKGRKLGPPKEEIPDLPTKPAKIVAKAPKAKAQTKEKAALSGGNARVKYADHMIVRKLKTDEEAKRHKYWALYDGEPTVKEVIERYLAAGASLSIARLQLSYESLTGFISVSGGTAPEAPVVTTAPAEAQTAPAEVATPKAKKAPAEVATPKAKKASKKDKAAAEATAAA